MDIDPRERQRLDDLVEQSLEEIDYAVLAPDLQPQVGVYAMFSGGYDSLTSTAVTALHPNFQGVVHINTGIGVEETRTFVRETCEREGWPLIERFPPYLSYEDMILEHGFPGPGSHSMMYRNLKEKVIRDVTYELQAQNDKGFVVFTTGVRITESRRRMENVKGWGGAMQRNGHQVWLAPIRHWTSTDTHRYVAMRGFPTNPVSDTIHMSGECLCGSFATKGEFEELEMWYPETAARIRELEKKVEAAGQTHCRWGWGSGFKTDPEDLGPLCTKCELNAAAAAERHEHE